MSDRGVGRIESREGQSDSRMKPIENRGQPSECRAYARESRDVADRISGCGRPSQMRASESRRNRVNRGTQPSESVMSGVVTRRGRAKTPTRRARSVPRSAWCAARRAEGPSWDELISVDRELKRGRRECGSRGERFSRALFANQWVHDRKRHADRPMERASLVPLLINCRPTAICYQLSSLGDNCRRRMKRA